MSHSNIRTFLLYEAVLGIQYSKINQGVKRFYISAKSVFGQVLNSVSNVFTKEQPAHMI